MSALLVMTLADLRQRVRDRTVVIFGLLVPMALIVVFNAVFGGTDELELEPVTVAVAVPDGDRLGAAVVGLLGSLDVVDVTVEAVPAAEVAAAAEDGTAELGLLVPEGFTEAVQEGRPVTVQVVEGDGAGLEGEILQSVVAGAVDQMHAAAVAGRAGALAGLSEAEVGRIAEAAATQGPEITLSQGAAADEQLSPAGALVAGQAGLFLLFTVGFGVLALLTEREQGTLARLRSMPMSPGLVVAAKVLSGFVLGVVATTVLLVAGGWLFDVSFGDPVAVGVLVLCSVAAATSLTFVVARVSRTAEQASTSQAIIALVLGVAGGAFFPLAARGFAGQVLDVNPVAALQRGLGITSGGGGLPDIGAPVLSLLLFALTCVLVSRVLPDRGATR